MRAIVCPDICQKMASADQSQQPVSMAAPEVLEVLNAAKVSSSNVNNIFDTISDFLVPVAKVEVISSSNDNNNNQSSSSSTTKTETETSIVVANTTSFSQNFANNAVSQVMSEIKKRYQQYKLYLFFCARF